MTLATAAQCDETTARALTLALRQSLTVSWDLLIEAYQRRAWAALGYETWDAYTDAELGQTRLRLPREQRREVVASLTEAGMSTRAIGSALGISKNTVTEDRQQVSQPGTPESAPERDAFAEKIAAELAASDEHYAEQAAAPEPEPQRIQGVDGKSYPAQQPPPLDPGVTDWLNDSQEVKDSGYLREFTKTFARADDFLRFNAERLGPLIDQGELESLEMYAVSVGRFVDTVRRSRTGLRVINGGH